MEGEGGVPGDVLFFLRRFRRRKDGFSVLPVRAPLDVITPPGDVDDGSARGLSEPAGWCLRRKILPSCPILASPTATLPTGQPEFAVHKTESAPGSPFHSVIVKRPGTPPSSERAAFSLKLQEFPDRRAFWQHFHSSALGHDFFGGVKSEDVVDRCGKVGN